VSALLPVALFDFFAWHAEALNIWRRLRRRGDFNDMIFVALLPNDGSPIAFRSSSIDIAFVRPFDPKALADRLYLLLAQKKESA